MDFNYEYFCSANVVVEIEGMPLTEVAGLRLSLMESKRPIYGYSSRHFDAVASGQVLVEGALVLNYVDQNYLQKAIRIGLEDSGQRIATVAPPGLDPASELLSQIRTDDGAANLFAEYSQDPLRNKAISDAFKQRVWGTGGGVTPAAKIITPNPHDGFGGVDIRVTFGTKEVYNYYAGLTNFLIQSVHFLGRSMPISIGEDVIVEEFPFIGRNILQIDQKFNMTVDSDGTITNSASITN